MTLWPYQTAGDSTHPPVLFLHGFLGTGDDWLRVAQGLKGQYYCVLPDLPGHGKNMDLPITPPLSFDVLNRGLLALLDHLQLPQAHLVGYSLGGRAALYFAVHHPCRVASLLLESASPGLVNVEERSARAAVDDQRAESILLGGIETFVEQWYAMRLFRSMRAHPCLGKMIIRRKANHPNWAAKVIRELSPGRQLSVWDRLSRLEMPVLFVAGSLDEKYIGVGEQFSARAPHARLVVVPRAGHNIHFEQTENFVLLMRNFLNAANTILN